MNGAQGRRQPRYDGDVRACCLAWLAVAGCGRYSFDESIDHVGRCDEPFGMPVPIDTGGRELRAPAVTADELELFAQSTTGPNQLFVMTRGSKQDAFSAPVLVDGPFNSSGTSQSSPSISADGLDLYMTSHTANAYVNRAHRETRTSPFGELEGTGSYGEADVSSDQLEIYQQDYRTPIGWMSRTSTRVSFSNFQSLGVPVNDDNDLDGSGPSISHDGRELYFYSTRSGPRLIYVARRAEPGDAFLDVEPVDLDVGEGSPLNPEISSDGRRLYFEVERSGRYELYLASRCAGEAP